MTNSLKIIAAGAALLAATGAGAVNSHPGVNSEQFTLGIAGQVPVICRASIDAANVPTTAGQNSLGALSEFCNSANGYEVYADYPASLAEASLIVDGERVPFSAAGSTLVSKSDRASIERRDLALDLPNDAPSAQISFRIVPL